MDTKHSRWNPKMKRFIFEERNGLYIIDLAKTLQQIRNAVEIVQRCSRQDINPFSLSGQKSKRKPLFANWPNNAANFMSANDGSAEC